MINGILKGILKALMSVLNIFLLPVNALIENIFPSMTASINIFNDFINTYLGNTLSFFFSIFPPMFRSVLVVWFSFVIAYKTIHFTYISLIKIWSIIQKIKFW